MQLRGEDQKQRRKRNKFDPIIVLRKREIIPERYDFDEQGNERVNDAEMHYLLKFLRKNVKKGSLLNLGSGSAHVHQMCAVEDKLTHITALDISEKHNQVVKELLEGSQGIGHQELVEEIDIRLLRHLADALSKDKSYRIVKSGKEILSSLYKKSIYNGKLDIITADMLEKMKELKTGELVDNRKYDNITLLFAVFTRSKKELLKFFQSVKERLNDDGRILVIETKEYPGPTFTENVSLAEDELVVERYSDSRDLPLEEFIEIMEKAGFKHLSHDNYPISEDNPEEKMYFNSYIAIVAKK